MRKLLPTSLVTLKSSSICTVLRIVPGPIVSVNHYYFAEEETEAEAIKLT